MGFGGVFGMMTTMFASIAQRIRDIGVLRLLGFKRWQVTVSFLLESLTVAAIGGLLGCLLAYLAADGRSTTSNLQSGGGMGGKSFALTIDVDAQVAAMGLLSHGNVRLSLHRGTTGADVDRLLEVLTRVVAEQRAD